MDDRLLADIWHEVRSHILEEKRVAILARLIQFFEGEEVKCDRHVMNLPEGKEALKSVHPSWFSSTEAKLCEKE